MDLCSQFLHSCYLRKILATVSTLQFANALLQLTILRCFRTSGNQIESVNRLKKTILSAERKSFIEVSSTRLRVNEPLLTAECRQLQPGLSKS